MVTLAVTMSIYNVICATKKFSPNIIKTLKIHNSTTSLKTIQHWGFMILSTNFDR